MVQLLWETVWQFFEQLNMGIPNDTAISLLDIYPKKNENSYPVQNLYINVHISSIHNSQKVEKTQMYLNE